MSYYSQSQTDSRRAIGNRIRQLREAKEATQDDMAAFFGTQRSTVAKWENGAQSVRGEILDRMARYFDCSVDFLLRGSSAETYDIYRTTELVDAAIMRLQKENNSARADFTKADDEPVVSDLLNEMLADDVFYELMWQFLDLRLQWKKIQSEVKEQEAVIKAAEPRSSERRKANERIRELDEQAEFLLWKHSHRLDAYTRKLLGVK